MRDCPECGRSGLKDTVTMCRYCQHPIPVAVPGQIAAPARHDDLKNQWYCDHCGFIGSQRRYTKGSLGIEIFLYVLMIFPGVVYSLWRLTSKYTGCPKCATPNMMPATTPKALEAIAKLKRE